jgi:hypothetical protein
MIHSSGISFEANSVRPAMARRDFPLDGQLLASDKPIHSQVDPEDAGSGRSWQFVLLASQQGQAILPRKPDLPVAAKFGQWLPQPLHGAPIAKRDKSLCTSEICAGAAIELKRLRGYPSQLDV